MTNKTIDTIRLPIEVLRQVKDELSNNKKIAAIKLVRAHAPEGKQFGLKEAKFAVERLECEMGIKPMSNMPLSSWCIASSALIKAVKFDLGGGELEVNLEAMEMRALMGLDTMGIDEVARVLDLVKILKAFSEGANIYIDHARDHIDVTID